jgi:hypothetical protein
VRDFFSEIIDDQTPTVCEYEKLMDKKKYEILFHWFVNVWRIEVMQNQPFHVYGDELFKSRIETELKKHFHYRTMSNSKKRSTLTSLTLYLWVYRFDNWIFRKEEKARKIHAQ